MFQEACERAKKYTCPYVGLRRKHDGTVFSTMAAFIIVNDKGWAITVKHIFDEIANAQQSIAGVSSIDNTLTQLKAQKIGNAKHRNRDMRKLEQQKANSLSNHAEIWAGGANWHTAKPRATEIRLHPIADLAAFKLDPFTPSADQAYPILRSEALIPGVSVCRIGFPWHTVEAEFANNNFNVKSGFPAPLFALEGIVSRFAVDQRQDGSQCTYAQTSSPGLRGQSGGPLFDAEGKLCGLQSSTTHLDLGFDAQYKRDGQPKVERQFLNVGQAVHVDEISKFLDAQGIAYASE
jgi:hypothetical protein